MFRDNLIYIYHATSEIANFLFSFLKIKITEIMELCIYYNNVINIYCC